MYCNLKRIIVVAMVIVPFLSSNGQILQNLTVKNKYKSDIITSDKETFLPEIKDTSSYDLDFDFVIYDKQLEITDDSTKTYAPVAYVTKPLDRLYRTFSKIGFGTYMNPELDIYFNSIRWKDYKVAARLKHNSSFSDVEMSDGNDVYGGFHNNQLSVLGEKVFAKSVVTGKLKFLNRRVYYSGYETEVIKDKPSRDKGDVEKNTYNGINLNIGTNNYRIRKNTFKYDLGFDLKYFTDTDFNYDNLINLNADISQLTGKYNLYLNSDVRYLTQKKDSDLSNLNLEFNPGVRFKVDKVKMKFGVVLSYLDSVNNKFTVYPDINVVYALSNSISFFLDASGRTKLNTTQELLNRDPYHNNIQLVNPSREIANISVGTKGKLASSTTFEAGIRYRKISSEAYFINDTIFEPAANGKPSIQSKHCIVYDDEDSESVYANLNINENKNHSFVIGASYNNYSTDKQAKAWNKPSLEFDFYSQHKFGRFVCSSQIFVQEGRYAGYYGATNKLMSKKMGTLAGINLSASYRFTKHISAYTDLRNIMLSNADVWNNYPIRKFNFVFGVLLRY